MPEEKQLRAGVGRNMGFTAPIAEAFAAAAEHTALPLLLCDANATILAASSGAQALIERESQLARRDDCLQILGDQTSQRELISLIQQVLDDEQSHPRDNKLVLQLQRRGKPPLSLLVSPLPGGSRQWAAIYFHEPQFTARVSEAMLGRLYDLTRAEARVARLLINGANLKQIAETNGTSVHTVRNQTKAIFNKTGASRQAELAILLLTGPAHSR